MEILCDHLFWCMWKEFLRLFFIVVQQIVTPSLNWQGFQLLAECRETANRRCITVFSHAKVKVFKLKTELSEAAGIGGKWWKLYNERHATSTCDVHQSYIKTCCMSEVIWAVVEFKGHCIILETCGLLLGYII